VRLTEEQQRTRAGERGAAGRLETGDRVRMAPRRGVVELRARRDVAPGRSGS